jgi:hypothetical protein
MKSISEPKGRKIAVRVVDAGGTNIRDALISLFLDDVFGGALALGDGPGTFDIEGEVQRVQLTAEVGDLTQEAYISSQENAYQFQFQSTPMNADSTHVGQCFHRMTGHESMACRAG